MPKLALLLAIFVCAMATATARALEVTGWIISVDPEKEEIVLDNGQTFAVPDDISFASLSEDACVRIVYEVVDGVRRITEISLVTTAAARPPQDAAARAACEGADPQPEGRPPPGPDFRAR